MNTPGSGGDFGTNPASCPQGRLGAHKGSLLDRLGVLPAAGKELGLAVQQGDRVPCFAACLRVAACQNQEISGPNATVGA